MFQLLEGENGTEMDSVQNKSQVLHRSNRVFDFENRSTKVIFNAAWKECAFCFLENKTGVFEIKIKINTNKNNYMPLLQAAIHII